MDEFTSPDVPEAATVATVTLAQGLPNTKHALELSGSDATPIKALRIYQPPLGRK